MRLLTALLAILVSFALLTPAQTSGAKKKASDTAKSAPKSAAKDQSKAAKEAPKEPIDINTATADQLKSVPGIGDAYAKRIIDGRPYRAKNELVQKKILTEGVYNKVKDSIIAKQPSKK
ncbi:MAG: helix-hairpin-helix domain-containing protein [Acidobacteria bacterium]|nr:helix-hairpin-helix domain-containing protein [Acidobacteriota bacterium]